MEHPSWIGRTLGGRYRIDSMLGRGGMSAVYKATDPNLKRTVAIKLIHEHLSTDPSFVQRFESEASAVASLRHPNIVQVFDFNNDNNVYYMVLEFIPGETLQERLKRLVENEEQLPIEEALRITLNISDAVGYAHQNGMVHRDIKPANIMLDGQGRAILMDFGIVKILGGESHTSTGAMVGTVPYMSPEIIRGDVADLRSDIYSLGITFYEMLSGRPPFVADSITTVMMMHLNDPVPDVRDFRSEISPALVAILEKCLAKDGEDRYQSAAELSSDLRRALVNPDDATAWTPQPIRQKNVVVGESTSGEDETNTFAPMTDSSILKTSSDNSASKRLLIIGCLAVVILIGLISVAGIGLGVLSLSSGRSTMTLTPTKFLVTPTQQMSAVVIPSVTNAPVKTPTPEAPTIPPTKTFTARIAYVIQDAVKGGTNGSIFVANAIGAEKRDLTGNDCNNTEPDWSPDGKTLVYQSNCGGSVDIWRMGDDGKGKQALINDGSLDETEPDYSPSGNELVYVRHVKGTNYNTNGDIRIYEFGSGDYSTGLQGRGPVYSPDGSRIAYMSFDGTYWQLFVYDVVTKQNTQLTFSDNDCRWPAWSPDGKDIAYNSATGRGANPTGIWKISAEGGNPATVTSRGAFGRPSWSDTGWIVFNTTDGLQLIHPDGSGLHEITVDNGQAGIWSR